MKRSERILFYRYMEDLFRSPEVLSMHRFIQHGDITTLEHAICVALITFRICRLLHRDPREAVRGALLHDLYLYDWHDPVTDKEGGHRKLHGFTHPKTACDNASRLFSLTDKEKDIIRKHMWPLTVIPPRHLDGFIVSLADKVSSLQETFHISTEVQENARKLRQEVLERNGEPPQDLTRQRSNSGINRE